MLFFYIPLFLYIFKECKYLHSQFSSTVTNNSSCKLIIGYCYKKIPVTIVFFVIILQYSITSFPVYHAKQINKEIHVQTNIIMCLLL